MSMMKYCGAALCALAAILMLRGQKSEFSAYVSIGASVLLLGAAITAFLPLVEYIRDITENTAFSGYLGTVIKALGITLCVQLASEICKDSGEGALASKLELVGKAEVLVLCMPIVGELIGLASELLNV